MICLLKLIVYKLVDWSITIYDDDRIVCLTRVWEIELINIKTENDDK